MNVNRQLIATMLALLSVLMLWGMIVITDYVGDETTQNIMTVQGEYPGGDALDLYSGTFNVSQIANDDFGINEDYGWDENADTIYITNDDIAFYGNYQTYSGNNTYTCVVDWDDHLDYLLAPGYYEYIYIPLDMKTGELADFDFLRTHTNFDLRTGCEIYIFFEVDSTTIDIMTLNIIDNDTYMFINENNQKIEQTDYPNGTVWLVFEGYDSILDNFDGLNQTQTSFTWNVEAISIVPADTLFGAELTEYAVWFIIVVLFDVVLFFKIIFSNEKLDTAFGNAWEKTKRKRKG